MKCDYLNYVYIAHKHLLTPLTASKWLFCNVFSTQKCVCGKHWHTADRHWGIKTIEYPLNY